MSETEKHVAIQERIFSPLHIVERGAVVRERLLIAAICLLQASAIVGCRALSGPIQFYGHHHTSGIGFDGYRIDEDYPNPAIQSHFLWITGIPLTTSYKWREHEGPGAWIDHPDISEELTSDHDALLDGPFDEGVEYDFMPYGKDEDDVVYEGRMMIMQRIHLYGMEWLLSEWRDD